jgi:hypothetical protein
MGRSLFSSSLEKDVNGENQLEKRVDGENQVLCKSRPLLARATYRRKYSKVF